VAKSAVPLLCSLGYALCPARGGGAANGAPSRPIVAVKQPLLDINFHISPFSPDFPAPGSLNFFWYGRYEASATGL
jgi:hypothetical protein